MSRAESPYYRPLLQDSIRLLCLLPHEDENAPIRCRLFEYTLRESEKRTQPYDALSYVWGNTGKPRFISIGEYDLLVTENLYVALSRLRYRSIERIIWVDAVCINQGDEAEKEKQIPFMANIYGQARCVVVWLGEAADNSDQALEEIRIAGDKRVTNSEVKQIDETTQSAILALFQRSWFRRIWVRERTPMFEEITKTSF